MRGEFVDLGGARLYYYAAGTRGAGEPVVFIHGFPTSAHLWGDVVPLMPPGHRLVVLDLLGYGRSDRPVGRRMDILAHAGRVVHLLDELGIERACLVGHGIGGGIAQSVTVRTPKRVSRLCLVDSVGFDRWPRLGARFARATLPITRHLPPDALLAVVRQAMLRGYSDPSRAAHSLDRYLRPFTGPEGRDALVDHARALTNGETSDVGEQLASIRAPTAIVWGQHDRVTPLSVGQRLQRSIHNATLDVIANVKHFTPEEAPRQVADAVAALLVR